MNSRKKEIVLREKTRKKLVKKSNECVVSRKSKEKLLSGCKKSKKTSKESKCWLSRHRELQSSEPSRWS